MTFFHFEGRGRWQMTELFVSFAQNGEDVVLWRALQGIQNGTYVDVGAMHPVLDSVTKAFYDRGWRGLNIEPVPANAAAFASERPDDEILPVAITAESGQTVQLHNVVDTGLSTLSPDLAAGYSADGRHVESLDVPTVTLADAVAASRTAEREVHFLKVDVEGAEAQVLAGVDLAVWRPWILVIEATLPNSTDVAYDAWEPRLLECGYEFCLFDGLNRFYVAKEHGELKALLSYPACVLDGHVTASSVDLAERLESQVHAGRTLENARRTLEAELDGLRAERDELSASNAQAVLDVVRWRRLALEGWEKVSQESHHEAQVLRGRLEAEAAAARARLTVVEGQANALRSELVRVRERLEQIRDRAKLNRARADRLAEQLAQLQASVSWRATRPLRGVRRAQRKLKGLM